MFLFRNVEKSVYAMVKALFTAPTGGLAAPYTVYSEGDFWNDKLVPTFPYLFLMGYRVEPRQTKLPLIIVEVGPRQRSYYETGNRKGTYVQTALHVFGRTRGERSDLAAYLYHHLELLPLYDYSTDPPTLRYTVPIDNPWSVPVSPGEALGQEGVLANWESLQFGFQLRD